MRADRDSAYVMHGRDNDGDDGGHNRRLAVGPLLTVPEFTGNLEDSQVPYGRSAVHSSFARVRDIPLFSLSISQSTPASNCL